MSDTLKDLIINNPRAKERIAIKKAQHDTRKQIKGFCSNPYCTFCKK